MLRIAHCQCGSLRVSVCGDPERVYVCHCQSCQRRTGAAFGAGAYFKKRNVSVEGSSTEYIREAEDKRKVRFYFCSICGSNVYYAADRLPEHLGIAVGCFADRSFPAPTSSVWETSKHDWVSFPSDIQHFERGTPPNAG